MSTTKRASSKRNRLFLSPTPPSPIKRCKTAATADSVVKAYIDENDAHAVRVVSHDKAIFVVPAYVLQMASPKFRRLLERQGTATCKEIKMKQEPEDVGPFLHFLFHLHIADSAFVKITGEMWSLKDGQRMCDADREISNRLEAFRCLAEDLQSYDCQAHLTCLEAHIVNLLDKSDYQEKLEMLSLAQDFRWIDLARRCIRKFTFDTLLPHKLSDEDHWILGTAGFLAYRQAFRDVDMTVDAAPVWFQQASKAYALPPDGEESVGRGDA